MLLTIFVNGQVLHVAAVIKGSLAWIYLDRIFLEYYLLSIGNLTFLRFIRLSGCTLRGIVPEEIGRLKRLQVFNMSSNSLQGGIPLHLMNCSELRAIDLNRNGLTGSIPDQLAFLPKLEIFSIIQNNLTGEIPSSLGNISSLTLIRLGGNSLTGSIPSSLGKLKSLTGLQLGLNDLSGTVPSSLYNLSSLTAVSLVDNGLSGNILEKMGISLPHLEWVAVGKNYFTGVIPPAIANISNLRVFDVGGNQLHGSIPKGIGMLRNLGVFSVGTNELGNAESHDLDFITSFANLSSLWYLGLMFNQFGGEIPSSVGNLSRSLRNLNFGNNRRISGSIPVEIGNLFNLVQLGMENNNLTSEIPASVCDVYKLEHLYLGGNNLNGSIPSSVENLTSLYILVLPGNQLKGSLPLGLKKCINLQTLNIANNRLSGDFSLNMLSSLTKLSTVYMSGNIFSGVIPSELGNLIYLSIFDISENQFTGEIPNEIAYCLMLETLVMGGNMFTGQIPLSLSSLRDLQIIDLSRNKFSGNIPPQLQSLSKLMIFNVSFNQLEGEVPETGVFSNLSAVSLQGNFKLCGGVSALKLPPCSNTTGKHISITIIIVATLSGILLLALIAVIVFFSRKRSATVKLTSHTSMNDGGYLRLSYRDLLEATDHFSPANLIGVGSFGSVYKGFLKESENLIAVKVMDLTKHGAVKSFATECRALSKIRHKNLLRIMSCCSSLDFKGNDFMALVYELMPNGSLHTWLHESRTLKLDQRINIAIDIASALDYLHHNCIPQIAHCDLKPSNVLLDDDKVAHVGDFGLAKLLHFPEVVNDGSSSFVIKGTVGYIPPEYGMGGSVSTLGDMYSFGILLLEMITGKRPTDEMFKDGLDLHRSCKSALSNGTILDILDPVLISESCPNGKSEIHNDVIQQKWECAAAVVSIGIACSSESPDERTDIRHVFNELISIKRKLQTLISSASHYRLDQV
uniref:non-specific serine/threonine protein kinase n=1 Tax=Sedum alfredii TaxID=439688 RepID=A0A410N654_9MAGN|nr:LRR receptor-like serine/threonine-protein kinase EFR [Sedum alfredii]